MVDLKKEVSKVMDEEIPEIYEKLSKPEGFRGIINSLYTNKIEKTSLVSIGISVVTFGLFYLIPPLRIFSQWPFIALLIFIMIYTLAFYIGQFKYILIPVKAYVSDFAKKIESEKKLVDEISKYSSQSIKAAQLRIEFEIEQLHSRVGFLLGVMDKLGIIPSLIALYLSYAKIMNDPTLEKIPTVLLGLLVGVYLGAFFAKNISSKLSLMSVLLKQALELSEKR